MTDPTPTNWRALCAELFAIVEDEYSGTSCLAELRIRTATALSQPEPKMVYRYSPVTIAECGGPCEQGPQYCDCGEIKGEPESQPEPQGPSVEVMAQIVYENAMLATAPEHAKPHWPSWNDLPNSDARIHSLNTAEIILARYDRPAIESVPVSERLPGPEDCDAEGRCWMCGKVEGDWRLISTDNPGVPQLKYAFSHWLPHWALPVPKEAP